MERRMEKKIEKMTDGTVPIGAGVWRDGRAAETHGRVGRASSSKGGQKEIYIGRRHTVTVTRQPLLFFFFLNLYVGRVFPWAEEQFDSREIQRKLKIKKMECSL